MRHRRAFTLVELLVVIGIIAILISIIIPVATKARASALNVQCSSNLHQIGVGLIGYFNQYRQLPVRDTPLDVANPHVFKHTNWEPSVAESMEKFAGSRKIYYCPANTIERTVENWWPYKSGTIAGTYQFPFWLNQYFWMFPKPDYRRLGSQKIIGADYLGVSVSAEGEAKVVAWNHEKIADGSPRGMNMLYGDGHVEWHSTHNGWQLYGYSYAMVYWFYGK